MIQLSRLTYYPIKACRGFDLQEACIGRMGLENDRLMMVVTQDGGFLTQREHPRLALVRPALEQETLTLSAPNFESLSFTIQRQGAINHVDIWKSKGVEAVDQGDAPAEWFSEWLAAPVRLVQIAEGIQRRLNPEYAVQPDDHTGFADGYPVLILSEESLEDLNSRLDSPLPMNRFRPNMVVKGCGAFEEDTWRKIQIDQVEMALVKPCPRCVVTTIDKETLEKGREPLKTLEKYRRHQLGAIFGMNAIPLNGGRLETGMKVEVLEWV